MSTTPRKKNGYIYFKDYPEFKPNLTPKEIFRLGSFGGTYWRPIYSSIIDKNLKNQHKKFPDKWWKGISEDKLIRPFDDYDTSINKYKVKVGTTLEFWEDKGWISEYDTYGWVQWYCNFYLGRRTLDDERQINRWKGIAGDNGRFRKWLVTLINKNNTNFDDDNISPKIRQTLQHWGYILTEKDYKDEIKSRN
jgi:hypothetical protein